MEPPIKKRDPPYFRLFLYSGKPAKCSRIAPQGHGFDGTSKQKHTDAGQEYIEVEHKYAEAENNYDEAGHGLDTLGVIFMLRFCLIVLHLWGSYSTALGSLS